MHHRLSDILLREVTETQHQQKSGKINGPPFIFRAQTCSRRVCSQSWQSFPAYVCLRVFLSSSPVVSKALHVANLSRKQWIISTINQLCVCMHTVRWICQLSLYGTCIGRLILHSVLFFFFFAYSVIKYITFMKRLQMCQKEALLGPTRLKYNIVQICWMEDQCCMYSSDNVKHFFTL